MPEKEYIERNKALLAINQFYHVPKIDIAIRNIPTADVAEVKHGHVIEHQGHEDEYYCECSVCKSREICIDDKFCSECGAKLDGKDDSNG